MPHRDTHARIRSVCWTLARRWEYKFDRRRFLQSFTQLSPFSLEKKNGNNGWGGEKRLTALYTVAKKNKNREIKLCARLLLAEEKVRRGSALRVRLSYCFFFSLSLFPLFRLVSSFHHPSISLKEYSSNELRKKKNVFHNGISRR